MSKNHMTASLSGKRKTIRFKNLNNLASGKRFHALHEGDFYIGDNGAFFMF